MVNLVVKNLNSFYQKKHVLKNFSYTFESQKIYCIVGPSGSGKTTLLSHLAGLKKTVFGLVTLGENKIGLGWSPSDRNSLFKMVQRYFWQRKPEKKWHHFTQLVFQFPEIQIFHDSVLKDVAFGPKNFGLSKDQAEQRAKETLLGFGVPEELWNVSPYQLSDGQKRRIALAGIFAIGGQVLLLDEPLSGLDPEGKQTVINKIRSYDGIVIVVTHDYDMAFEIGDEILLLEDGELKCSGDPYVVFQKINEKPHILEMIMKLVERNSHYKFLLFKKPKNILELVNLMKEDQICRG